MSAYKHLPLQTGHLCACWRLDWPSSCHHFRSLGCHHCVVSWYCRAGHLPCCRPPGLLLPYPGPQHRRRGALQDRPCCAEGSPGKHTHSDSLSSKLLQKRLQYIGPVYPYGYAIIPTDSDLKFRCYAGWVRNYGHCPIFPFPLDPQARGRNCQRAKTKLWQEITSLGIPTAHAHC